jgi:hypothetical protein
MSQISTENNDNISMAAANFVQALEAKMNEVVQMLSTQSEQHRKEMAQVKDGFTKEMEQLKVNVWGIIHLNYWANSKIKF